MIEFFYIILNKKPSKKINIECCRLVGKTCISNFFLTTPNDCRPVTLSNIISFKKINSNSMVVVPNDCRFVLCHVLNKKVN